MFLEASGLEINEDKSQVFFFNSPQVNRRNFLQILRFKEGTLPNKYLGAPLLGSQVKQVSWK